MRGSPRDERRILPEFPSRLAYAPVHVTAPDSSATSFSDAYVRYALALIFLVAVFNVCDRTIMSVLVPEMRAELGLTDRQLGILMGPAFAAVHVVAGLPIARLADRAGRSSSAT